MSAWVGGYAERNLPGARGSTYVNGAGETITRTEGSFSNRFGASMARSIANAATRSLIDGTDFGDNIIASLPDVLGQTMSLPNIPNSPNSAIAAVQTTDPRLTDNASPPLDFPAERCLLAQGKMGAVAVVVGHIIRHQQPQVRRAKDDDVIEAFAPD